MLNGIILALLAIAGVGIALWIEWRRRQLPDDARLDEWLGFLIKNENDDPSRMPRITSAELPVAAYEQIKGFCNPKLKAEYTERLLKLENEIAARSIQIEKVARRMAKGQPLSKYDDKILIREKLRGEGERETRDELLEFTPGKQWGKNEDTDYIADPE